MQTKIDELWQLVSDAFDRPDGWFSVPICAANGSAQMGREVRFRLLNAVAELKRAEKPAQELLDTARGDVLLANASGWMPDDACDRAQKILDELESYVR